MLVTVENQLSTRINYLEEINTAQYLPGNPAGLVATGGNVVQPLPFPFDQVGELAANGLAGDDVQRAMHPSDFRRQHNLHKPMEPREEWNQIIQAGIVTFVIASETGFTDTEETFIAAV